MKKFRLMLIVILTFVCALSVFAACGGKKNQSNNDEPSISESIEESSSSSIKPSSSSVKPSSSSQKPSSSSVKPSSSSVKPSSSSQKPSSSSSQAVKYTVTITSSTGGKVTADKTSAEQGSTVKLTIAADAGYRFQWLKVNGTTVNVTGTTYSFAITKNTTITYSFAKEYSISINSSSTNGNVSVNKNTAIVGEKVTFTVTPNSNYILSYLKINGTSVSVSNNKYEYTMTAANVAVTFEFVRVYGVVKAGTSNGSFTVSSSSAIQGTAITVTATPSTGYVTGEISISYGTTTTKLDVTSNKATFTMPNAEVTVKVTFVKTDNREYVSHMIFGDSYTHHQHFFRNFYTDMQDLPQPKILGIGGTQIPQWGKTGTTTFQNKHLNTAFIGQGGLDGKITQFDVTRTVNITAKYNVQNFVFHIGINDINGGTSASAVINDLKILFSQYHEAYPNANIYWISLSLITSNPGSIDAVKQVNSAIKTYADQTAYLNYINTVDTMFPNGVANGDWFNGDGLHFNVNGYATWSSLILKGLGYPRKDIGTAFGNAGAYYSSNNWTEKDGIVSNSFNIPVDNDDISLEGGATAVIPFTEQSLWFKDVYSVDAYAEMKVSVKSVAFGDQYPKFGLSLKGEKTQLFFFVDALGGLTGTGTSFTENKVKVNGSNVSTAMGWDWTIQKWGKTITGSYSNGNYIKIALLRTGTEMYFLVNDVIVLDLSGREFTSGNMAIGFTTFALEVNIKDYSVTTNVASKLSSLGIKTGGSAYFAGAKDTLDVTTGPDKMALLENVNASKFYYEATIKANSVLNSDKYPKFGLVLENAGSQLFFYVDALAFKNNGTGDVFDASVFGTNKFVGFVHKAAGATDWNWAITGLTHVPSLSYGNGSTVKIAIYKDGAKIVGLINGVAVINTSAYTDMAGNVKVGYLGFNIDADVSESKLVTSNTLLNIVNQNYGLKNDLTIDGNLSDWSATQKANPYGATATDGSGKKFTVYSFMGSNGIYVGYEMIHASYVSNLNEWFNCTNFEMFVGANKEQCYASANGATRNIVSHAIKSVKNGSLYTTTCELVISYAAVGYTGSESSVKVGFACKTGGESAPGMVEGNAGDWWCGPKHASNNQSTVAKAGGIS